MVGEEFVRRTARQHFIHNRSTDAYAINHFEVNIITGDTLENHNRFLTGRICNGMIYLFNTSINMPKMVFVILEDDMINYTPVQGVGAAEHYEVYIEDIIRDFNRIVNSFKQIIPKSATRCNWPKLIFINATLHRNYNNYRLHKEFNEVLDTVTNHHNNVWSAKLLQLWDENDINLFLKHEQRFTKDGLDVFWSAVDRTIAFCNRRMECEEAKYSRQQNAAVNNKNKENADRPQNDRNSSPRDRKIFWNRGDHSGKYNGGPRRRLPKP